MMQLDPACSKLVTSHISGGILFLDTNFIYRLLGLNDKFGDDTLASSAKSLLEKSRNLGYVSVISPRTIKEYKISLKSAMRRISRFASISPEVAKAANAATHDTDFVTHYWRLHAERNGYVSPDSFYSHYAQMEILLEEQFGIKVDNSFDKHISSNVSDLSKEEALLRNSLPRYFPPHDDIVTHDAHMRLLILQLRQGSEDVTPLQTRYWFITCDTKLVRYDRIARSKQNLKVPFCALSSHWAQLISPFATTPEEYELLYASIFETTLFRSFPSPKVEHIQSIIEKMAFNQQIPPSATARILLDEAFVKSFSEKPSENEQNQYFEDYFFGEFVIQLEEEQHRKDKEIELLKEQLHEMTMTKEYEKEEANILQDALKSKIDVLENQVVDISKEIDLIHKTQLEGNAQKQEEVGVEKRNLNEQLEEKYYDGYNSDTIEIITFNNEIPSIVLKLDLREQKLIAFIVIWLLCILALLIFRPWENQDSLRYLIFSFPMVCLVLTQIVFFWPKKLSKLSLVMIGSINVTALIFSILLPLGLKVSDIILYLTTLATVVAGVASVVQLFDGPKES